jgi:CBS domain-containing protein
LGTGIAEAGAMSVGKICVREVVVVSPEDSLRDATALMAAKDVGTLVVIDRERRPLGILTDRDVALRVVADGRDPEQTRVGGVMTAPAVTIPESAPIETALGRMAGIRARRLVVVDAAGRLVGILALDDLLDLLVEEAGLIGKILAGRSGGRGA